MNEVSASLVAVLNEQIGCAEAMLETLARENEALVAGDTERLNETGAEKARLVEKLDALETERRGLAEAIGAVFEAGSKEGSGAPGEWRRLLELVAECKERNRRNGALVKARSEQVRIALDALRGPEARFYEPTGLAPAARSARPLGTA